MLTGLLAALLLGTVTFERGSWPSLVGDEASYLMAAESLAWDLDLAYSRSDYDRFVRHWGVLPEGVILQSGDGGRSITYGKPFFYPLAIAPLVRLSPTRGPFVANALMLALAAALSVWALGRRHRTSASPWIALALFGSVAFANVFWAHADLFLLALTAIALSLALGGAGTGSRRGTLVVWGGIGALLAVVVFSRPFYLLLLPAVAFATPPYRRRPALAALIGGAAGVVLLAVLVHLSMAGSPTGYTGERHGFYQRTGFPLVDFPAEEWGREVEELGNAAWAEARFLRLPPIDASLTAWNALYFLVGRHVGLLAYFLPALLLVAARPRDLPGWALTAALAAAAVAFLVFRPFNFWGGGSALANRYFLPLYPVCWFAVGRPVSGRVAGIAAAVAALFLWPLWTAPRAFPLRADGTYRFTSPAAERLLPFETSQSHLKPGGREDIIHGDLWVKFLDRRIRPSIDGERLVLEPGVTARLLVGSPRPLTGLEVRFLAPPDRRFTVAGAVRGAGQPDVQVYRLDPPTLRARHPMWWTWDPYYLYSLALAAPESRDPTALTLAGRGD